MIEFRKIPLATPKPKRRLISPFYGIIGASVLLLAVGAFYAYNTLFRVTDAFAETGVTAFCLPANLSIRAKFLGEAAGSRMHAIRYTNIGKTTCALQGFPTVKLKDTAGAVLAVYDYNLPMDAKVEILGQQESAQSFVIWGNWCGKEPSGSLELYIKLPGSPEELKTKITDMNGNVLKTAPTCTGDKNSKSSVAIGPFVTDEE